MDINPRILRQSISETLGDIERQLEQVHKLADEMDTLPSRIKDTDGNFVMTPLLMAKAQMLHALALLQKEKK